MNLQFTKKISLPLLLSLLCYLHLSAQQVIFYEDFSTCNGSGGNGESWGKGRTNKTAELDFAKWESHENLYQGNKCLRLGSIKYPSACIITKGLNYKGPCILSLRAGRWSNKPLKKLQIEIMRTGKDSLIEVEFKQAGHFYYYQLYIPDMTKDTRFAFTNKGSGKNIFLLDDIKIIAGTPTSFTQTISDVGYSTLYFNKPLVLPTGLIAHTIQEKDDHLYYNQTYNEGDILPPETGLVLEGNKGSYVLEEPMQACEIYPENLLKGDTVTAMIKEESEHRYYMLSLDELQTPGSVGFYYGSHNGKPFESQAYKAYLSLHEELAKRIKGFPLSQITTRCQQQLKREKNNSIYDLQGRKRNNVQPGLQIINGKKYILR